MCSENYRLLSEANRAEEDYLTRAMAEVAREAVEAQGVGE